MRAPCRNSQLGVVAAGTTCRTIKKTAIAPHSRLHGSESPRWPAICHRRRDGCSSHAPPPQGGEPRRLTMPKLPDPAAGAF